MKKILSKGEDLLKVISFVCFNVNIAHNENTKARDLFLKLRSGQAVSSTKPSMTIRTRLTQNAIRSFGFKYQIPTPFAWS
jgi:hypothetical protein